MSNLPENLKIIPPVSSVDECMEIVVRDFDRTNQESQYRLYLAKNYFRSNLELFSPNQVNKLFEYPHMASNFGGTFPKESIEYSIKNKCLFPKMYDYWFTTGIKDNLKRDYLEILNKNGDKKQIELFCQKATGLVDSFINNNKFKNGIEVNQYLIECAQKYNPENILFNDFWSKDKILYWMKESSVDIKSIAFKFAHFKINLFGKKNQSIMVPNNVRDAIYENLSEKIVSVYQKNKIVEKFDEKGLVFFLSLMPDDYWSFVENNYPGQIRKLFKENSEKEGVNNAQWLLSQRGFKRPTLSGILKNFEHDMDLLLRPVEEKIGSYKKITDPLELALRQKNWSMFLPFGMKINMLSEEQKEIQMAAAFSFMIDNSTQGLDFLNRKENEKEESWVSSVFCNTEFKIFKKHLQENKFLITDDDLKKELELIYLARKIEEKLPEKIENKKQNKI